jgi:hypothetical protein
MKHVLAVVCANGLGHFRRSVAILDRLLAITDPFALSIVAETWQWERTREWPASARLRRIARHFPGVMEPGVIWSSDPRAYDGDRLTAWLERLRALEAIERADLVLSDNLAGVLSLRSDAVLLGSFLWSEVLADAHPTHPRVAELAKTDHALLTRAKPPMLCVEALAMPGVLLRTDPVQLPWMCESVAPSPRPLPEKPRIAVLGGATGSAARPLTRVIERLEAMPVIVERGGEAEPRFDTYDLVVLRPGAGTVTACVAARVPMILAYEPNPELAHNASRIEALGIGLDAGPDPDPERVIAHVERVLDPSVHSAMSATMASMPSNGIDRAASWLRERLASRP